MPLHQATADLFRTLGHPARIRILEVLADGPKPVHGIRAELGFPIEPSTLSQHLTVLRRAGLLGASRTGATITYGLIGGSLPKLLADAKVALAELIIPQASLLDQLRTQDEQTG